MCAVEGDMLTLLGHMPGEEEDLVKKLTDFEREKRSVLERKRTEHKQMDTKLSRHKFEKEQDE